MQRKSGKLRSKAPLPRALLAFCTVLLLLAAQGASGGGSATALAAAPLVAGGRAVIVNTDGDPIRVRQDAGTQFAQLSSAYEGQIVTVLAGPSSDATGKQWFKVHAPSGAGWIAAEFLEGTSASAPAPAHKLTGSARVANTDGDPLRVRVAPSAGAGGKILTLLDPGTTVAIQAGPLTDDTGVVWYEITAKGFTGWAMAQYLAQAETAQTAKPPAGNGAAGNASAAQTTPTPVKAVATARSAATVAPSPTAKSAKPAEKPTAQPTAVPKQGATGATSSMAQYRQWVDEARIAYPYAQSTDKMWSVMMCESGGNPRASGGGGGYLGLFQYAPGTWAGSWNPYRSNSIWDARSQIFATARAWSIGMQGAWSCYYITAGR